MEFEHWSIVAEAADLTGYEADLNLLLMTFRIESDDLSPFVMYKLMDTAEQCSRSLDIMYFTLVESRLLEVYSLDDIKRIDASYEVLRLADAKSNRVFRVHNAIHFLYLAHHSSQWLSAFLFYMSAIEALFSKDSKGGATATICRRVPKFLNNQQQGTSDDMNHLYDIRSRIVHGDIEASEDPKDNLLLLQKLERIVTFTFRKLIQEKKFRHFANKQTRDQFLSNFDR